MSMTNGTTGISADEARAITREAWAYAYAPLQGYQTKVSASVSYSWRTLPRKL